VTAAPTTAPGATRYRRSDLWAPQRDLTRTQLEERLTVIRRDQRPVMPRSTPQDWPQTRWSAGEVLVAVDGLDLPGNSVDSLRRRRRSVREMLDWLAQFPGETWQQRWLASGLQDAGRDWLAVVERHWPSAGTTRYRRCSITTGLTTLLCAQIIRPSYAWLLAQHFNFALSHAQRTIDPDGFARLEAHCETTGRDGQARSGALGCIAMMLFSLGGTIAEITVDDCIEFANLRRATHASARHVPMLYALLVETGVFGPEAPLNLLAARSRGQRSLDELVDDYQIQSAPMRELLLAYLYVRKPDLDYASLRSLVSTLCRLFWRDIELHHPGADSLRLRAEVVAGWKERVRGTTSHGAARERPEAVLGTVRAFYLDLAQWALEDPARWAPWVAPCPIRAAECLATKQNRRRRARMHQRVRTLAPALPALVSAVQRRLDEAQAVLTAATSTLAGGHLVIDGETVQRLGQGGSGRVFVCDSAGRRRDLTYEEDNAFWAWATIEVLRHTGMRIEELLELTHHSFVAYTLPTTGEVVPMLQVAPSKTDTERLLLVSPELGDVLTAIIYRVRRGKAALPLVSRYDHHERLHSLPMPFLFQRFRYGIEATVSRNFIANAINGALAYSGLTDQTGNPLRFTPHDFRRIFATDAIRTGLPPHITAKILGHANINTTMGYAAIYPEDVINHHRAFITRRRALRPSEEYRDLTADEWQEFLGHFELRKVELGVCTRDFGTPCVHEHACIRCPALRPDPAQAHRLETIIGNLDARLAEAREHGWLGEVAGLQVSRSAAEQKLTAMRQLAAQHQTTHLGMPDYRPVAGRTSMPDSNRL
jgi:integrase